MTFAEHLLRNYTRVRLEANEQILEVGDITWDGPHTPVISWFEAARFPPDASAADVDRARRKLLQSRKLFVICKECGQHQAKGRTADRVCHECMERNHGVVF